MSISNFLGCLKDWVEEDDMINCAIMLGEYTSEEIKEDSILRLVLITSTPKLLINHKDFINKFGRVTKSEHENQGRMEAIKVEYEDGLKTEFYITSPLWISRPLSDNTVEALKGGYKVILDKKHYFTNLKLLY